ncbi:MAG: hypothetical protein OS112_09220 [Methanoregula sp.]|nr:MAG: hypothetical protein OS112_09220 [Methanoregula sp.]
MKPPRSENALSEVIGFILILVVIMTAFSIYLTYAVPAQGRENEILHMNEIRDEFVKYKVGVDALWTNSQVGTAMSTTFNLGTAGTATQGGGFSIIPVMNPIPSSGMLALNQRQEVLTVQSRGLIRDGKVVSNQTLVPGSFVLNATPQQFIVNISDTTPSDYSSGKRSVLVQQAQNWSVNVTVNPRTTYYNYSTSCNPGGCNYADGIRYTGTDITIDISKGGVVTLQDYTVYKNIQPWSSVRNYSVNLLDDAYGLKNNLADQPYPMTVTFTKYGTLVSGYGIVSLTDEYEKVATHSLALGSLEYTANNNYWIPQTYYYQNGGVFLQQDDGTSVKLPSAITFSYNCWTRVIGVNIIELPFQQADTGNIGGNSPAQVKTQVTNIQDLPYSLTYNNTKWINISMSSNDSRAVASWLRSLNSTANISQGIPDTYYRTGLSGVGAFIYFTGSDSTNLQYDMHVEGLRANLSATVQGG